MLLSEKITFIILLWIVFVLVIAGKGNLEIFFILSFIGILVIREISDVFITEDLKGRMNLFICLFVIVFIIIVGKKIMNIMTM